MKDIYNYNINKIRWWERILLFFKKPTYVCDSDNNIISEIKYKHLFGKTYILKENISIKRKVISK